MIYRLVHCFTLIREASFCITWWLIQTPTAGPVQRIRDCAVLISKWDIYVTSLPPRLKDHCRRWHGKIVRLRGHRHLQGNSVCWKWVLTPVDSQWLWLYAQNLHKMESVKIPAWMGQGLTPNWEPIDDYWLLLERECVFFRDVSSERLPMLLEEMVLQPYTCWQHKVDSVGLRKSSWRTRKELERTE